MWCPCVSTCLGGPARLLAGAQVAGPRGASGANWAPGCVRPATVALAGSGGRLACGGRDTTARVPMTTVARFRPAAGRADTGRPAGVWLRRAGLRSGGGWGAARWAGVVASDGPPILAGARHEWLRLGDVRRACGPGGGCARRALRRQRAPPVRKSRGLRAAETGTAAGCSPPPGPAAAAPPRAARQDRPRREI